MFGDYNVIAIEGESKDGLFLVSKKIHDFRTFITKAGDQGFIAPSFT